MSRGLRVLRQLDGHSVVLRALGGKLDENLSPDLFAVPQGTSLVLDLARVAHVSSFGVRDWIRILQPLPQTLGGLYFLRMSPRLTDQLNMVVGFDAGGSVLSFHATYICDTCDSETPALFDMQLDREIFQSLAAPMRQCRICGRPAELDDEPSVLFEYARSTHIAALPAGVLQLLRQEECWVREVPGVRLTTRQFIKDDAVVIRLSGIVDSSLPAKRIVRCAESGPVQLSLSDITHVEPSALTHLRAMLDAVAEQGSARLTGVPPVLLRYLAENPATLGIVPVESVLLPMRCIPCHHQSWALFPADPRVSWTMHRTQCARCQNPLGFALPDADLQEFHRALAERPEVLPIAVQPAATARTKSKGSLPLEVARQDDFDEKFEILCKIARGGMADVYLVRQHGAMGFKRIVVIKKVREEFLTDDRMVRLFLDEARLAAQIDHHNVVRVHDLGRTGNTFYMVMDFVHGRSLTEILKALGEGRGFPPRIAVSIAADLCAALARAHNPDSSGKVLVHRDVTPNNVLMSFDGVVKLADFGLAGYRHFEKDRLRAGHLLGNVPFIAPEIYLGKHAVPQSDLWGVGLVLFVLLAGEHPFLRGDVEKTALAIVHEPIKRPWSKIPRKLFALIETALQKNPDARFASAQTMEQELRALLTKLPEESEPGEWLRQVFAQQLKQERAFIDSVKGANLTDALLKCTPQAAQDFFHGEKPA